jgi:hypothetical protein
MPIDVQQVIITPEDASHLMEKNTANRLLSPRRVNSLAQSISRGEWVFDGNPIRLTSDGMLLDGQHRLAAIMKAGEPVSMLMLRGLEPESQLAIDSGRPRTFSDYLRMRGVPQVHSVAAATRLLANIDSGNYATTSWREYFTSNSALWTYFTDHREEITDGVSVARVVRVHIAMIPSVLSVLAVLLMRRDGEDAAEFFNQFSKKSNLSQPVRLLLRTLENRENKADTGAREQRVQLALGLKAWRMFRAGEETGQLLGFRRTEKFPEA